MDSTQRRFLLVEQGVGAGIVNAVLNALIAWLSFRGATTIPFWGQQSIGGDTIGTCFLLPLITTLIVTPLCRSRLRSGHIAPISSRLPLARALVWLPTGLLSRGIAFGILTAVLAAPPTILVLRLLGVDAWPLGTFVGYKTLFGGLLGALVTPIVALMALVAPEGDGAPAARTA